MGVWEILDSYQLDTLHRCRAPLSNTAFHTLFSRVFSYCQIFCTFVTKYLISKLKTTQVYFTTQRTVTVHTRTIILILCVLSFSPYKPHAPLYNIPAQPIQYSNTFVTKHLNFSQTVSAAAFLCVTALFSHHTFPSLKYIYAFFVQLYIYMFTPVRSCKIFYYKFILDQLE